MTKTQVIAELLRHVRAALDEKLADAEYSEFAGGSVSFRLDMVKKPSRTFVNVTLPPRTKTPKELKILFKRPYTRSIDRLCNVDTPVVARRRKGAKNAK